jgi:hypothetical protein
MSDRRQVCTNIPVTLSSNACVRGSLRIFYDWNSEFQRDKEAQRQYALTE